MCTMAIIIHRVVVVAVKIPAMIREGLAAVPKVVLQVQMVVVDATIDDSHHYTLTGIAHVPHLVGLHLDDIGRDIARGLGRSRGLVFRNHTHPLVKADGFDILTLGQCLDGLFVG